jgi:hypothetical protein
VRRAAPRRGLTPWPPGALSARISPTEGEEHARLCEGGLPRGCCCSTGAPMAMTLGPLVGQRRGPATVARVPAVRAARRPAARAARPPAAWRPHSGRWATTRAGKSGRLPVAVDRVVGADAPRGRLRCAAARRSPRPDGGGPRLAGDQFRRPRARGPSVASFGGRLGGDSGQRRRRRDGLFVAGARRPAQTARLRWHRPSTGTPRGADEPAAIAVAERCERARTIPLTIPVGAINPNSLRRHGLRGIAAAYDQLN